MNKKYYNLYLVKENEEIFLAKVNSKGLAYRTLQLYKEIYKNDTVIMK